MTTTTKDRLARLWRSLSNKKYRDAFVSEHIGSGVGVQIHEIRKGQGLTQKELGRRADMSQDRISKLENGDRLPNLNTLARVASALDCGLKVEFVSFSELARWAVELPGKSPCVPSFVEDSPKAAGFETHTWASMAKNVDPVRTAPERFDTERTSARSRTLADEGITSLMPPEKNDFGALRTADNRNGS